jgi:hypothetical protein
LETLVAILNLHEYNHLVISVLPLMARYGSWRDLRQLAVILSKGEASESSKTPGSRGRIADTSSTSSSTAMVEESASEMVPAIDEATIHPVVKLICDLFAQAMRTDYHAEDQTPSNACKYAPHSKRSFGYPKKTKEGTVEKKRKSTEEITGEDSKRQKTPLNMINRMLAAEIEKSLCPEEYRKNHGEAAYRKIRSSLNRRLEAKGHLIEPLLCRKELTQIDFVKANKGSLTKVTKSIKKHPEIMTKWKAAMATNAKAINDLDSIYDAISDFHEDMKDGSGIFQYRVAKALKSMKTTRAELIAKANKVLAQASMTPIVIPPVAIYVDSTGASTPDARLSLVLAGYLAAKSLDLNFLIYDGVEKPFNTIGSDGGEHEIPWYEIIEQESIESIEIDMNDPPHTNSAIIKLNRAIDLALQKLSASMTDSSSSSLDLVVFCKDVDHYNESQEGFERLLQDYQVASEHYRGMTLRTIRLHRLKQSFISTSEGEISYRPRRQRAAMPSTPAEITADVVFIVDFTGSMGSYIRSVKSEMVSIIRTLKESTGIGSVRIGLIGYRDYNDTDRIVRCDFFEQERLDELLAIIADQNASGGLLCACILMSPVLSMTTFPCDRRRCTRRSSIRDGLCEDLDLAKHDSLGSDHYGC